MLKNIEIKILNPLINELPTFATDGSAGIDLRAAIDKETEIQANECRLINTGISVYIADKNYAGVILPRSGIGHKNGIVLGNLVGLIDSDYQGELMISCWNRGVSSYSIKPLDRIAQMIFIEVQQPAFNVVKDFKSSKRGDKGFGSSGKN